MSVVKRKCNLTGLELAKQMSWGLLGSPQGDVVRAEGAQEEKGRIRCISLNVRKDNHNSFIKQLHMSDK